MKTYTEYLETRPLTDLQERVLKFMEDQKFIREHLQNGGSFDELKQMGFEFGTLDVSDLSQGKS